MSKLDELIKELCPNGVEYKTLENIALIKARIGWQGLTKDEYLNSGDYYLVTGVDFKDGLVDWDNCHYVTKDRYDQDTNIQIKNDDVLVTKDGTLGKVAFVQGLTKPATLNSGVFVIRSLDKNICNKFLFHYLKSPYLMKFANSKLTGGTIKHLNQSVITQLPIPVPPLPVQEEIVRILDKFTSLTAELTAELTARRKQYEYYRDSLFENYDGINGTILDMLSQPITDGPHTTPKLVNKGIPFISATAVYDGKIHLDDAKGFISEEFDLECCKKYKPQKNDVFMVKSGSTTGKVAFVDTDSRFNIWSPLAAMRTNKNNSPRFLYHLLQTNNIQKQVQEKMSHGSQPNLSMRVLESFSVKIPTLEQQNKIVDILDKLDIICNDIFSGLPAEIEARQKQYEYYRDRLLSFEEKEV